MSESAFAAAERASHAVAALRRVAGASVSGFHARLRAIPAVRTRAETEAGLRGLIGRTFAARRRACGSRRVHAAPRRGGRRHPRRRVERPMREVGLQARRGRRGPPTAATTCRWRPTCSTGTSRPSGPARSGWPTSATCRRTRAGPTRPRSGAWPRARSSAGAWPATSGPGCAWTRWSWPCGAAGRSPAWSVTVAEGVQHAAQPYRQVPGRHGIKQPMGRKGNRLDDAPMESFLASLEKEHVHHIHLRTRAEARAAVLEHVGIFCNRQRSHSALGYRTPAAARAGMEGIAMRAAA